MARKKPQPKAEVPPDDGEAMVVNQDNVRTTERGASDNGEAVVANQEKSLPAAVQPKTKVGDVLLPRSASTYVPSLQ